MTHIGRIVVLIWGLGMTSGCVSLPYQRLDAKALSRPLPVTPPGQSQIERGAPSTVIDAIGWVLGIPSKIILWNRRMDNHDVSRVTEESLRLYLAYNRLGDVKVRINQYAPWSEFGRLVRNKEVGWGWRYTLGVFSWLYGTILPGRLLGGDNYNPYTDTISLYSDVRAVALHEGGHAKDFSSQRYKGTYAFSYMLPVFSIYAEAQASSDAMTYLYTFGTAEEEKEACRTLYPAMGTYVGGMFSAGLGPLSPWYYAGVIPGHVMGRSRAAGVEEDREWRPLPEKREIADGQ